MTTELGDIIATRRLYLVDDPETQVVVNIGKPRPTPQHDDFFCTLQVTGIGDERVDAIYGIDSIQALLLTLKYAGATLVRLNKMVGGRLRWECDEGGGFGFPEL